MPRKMKDLSGQQFGAWTVIKYDYSIQGNAKWLCKCKCGSIKSVYRGFLFDGRSPHKGCRDCEVNGRKPEHNIRHLWASSRKCAKSRGIKFTLSKDDMWNLLVKQNFKCAITGEKLEIHSKNRSGCLSKDTSASLDRIDSNGIYEINNVQWVLKEVNQMKWNLSQNDFILLCHKVAQANPLQVNASHTNH